MDHRSIVGIVAILALAIALGGCSNSSAVLTPSPRSPIADVPVPQGFHIVLGRSESTVVPSTGLRLVNEYYKGSSPRLSTARFYLDNMPGNGWKLLEETQGSGGITEFFKKGSEDCTVTVRHGWFHTHLYIVITPTHAGASGTPATAATMPAGS